MLEQLRFTQNPRLSHSDHGATAIEYAMIVGIIGIGIISALAATKTSLNKTYGCITNAIDMQATGSGCGGGSNVALPSDPILAAAQTSLPAGTQVNSVTISPSGSFYSVNIHTVPSTKIYALDQSQGVSYTTKILSSGPNYYEVSGGTDYAGNPLFVTSPGQSIYAVLDASGKYNFFNVTKP